MFAADCRGKGSRQKKLLNWSRWFWQKRIKPTCSQCQRDQAKQNKSGDCYGIDYVDECPKKYVPKLTPANRKFRTFLDYILPSLFDGYGKINYSTINHTFEIFNIEQSARPDLLEKILLTASIKIEIESEEQKRQNAKHKTRPHR